MQYWGYQMIVDCGGCDPALMSSYENVDKWIRQLVKDIDMEPIGEPWIEYTAGDFEDKAGFTAVQIIVTSSIVAHFIDSTGDIYLDVFSCKDFAIDTVKQTTQEYFEPENIRINFLTRHAG